LLIHFFPIATLRAAIAKIPQLVSSGSFSLSLRSRIRILKWRMIVKHRCAQLDLRTSAQCYFGASSEPSSFHQLSAATSCASPSVAQEPESAAVLAGNIAIVSSMSPRKAGLVALGPHSPSGSRCRPFAWRKALGYLLLLAALAAIFGLAAYYIYRMAITRAPGACGEDWRVCGRRFER